MRHDSRHMVSAGATCFIHASSAPNDAPVENCRSLRLVTATLFAKRACLPPVPPPTHTNLLTLPSLEQSTHTPHPQPTHLLKSSTADRAILHGESLHASLCTALQRVTVGAVVALKHWRRGGPHVAPARLPRSLPRLMLARRRPFGAGFVPSFGCSVAS